VIQIRKTIFLLCGFLCVGLAVLGIFLPVLPTTPFLLLAAACFARSSTRFHYWLLNNRWFGSYIRNYREGRGLPLGHKIFTIALLWLTIGAAIIMVHPVWVKLLLAAVAAGVTLHLVRVKTYRPTLPPNSEILKE